MKRDSLGPACLLDAKFKRQKVGRETESLWHFLVTKADSIEANIYTDGFAI